nr:hypothetical protein [uncultured Flavobacterium sp.]
MNSEIQAYNNKQIEADKAICNLLATTINSELTEAENKIWHAISVWFLDGNPIVGYEKLKDKVRLLFWSGKLLKKKILKKKEILKLLICAILPLIKSI